MLKAFKEFGQASKSDVFNALKHGSGPRLNPIKLRDAFGQYPPNTPVIDIDIDLLQNYELGKASDTLLDATVLHELVHYFDYQDHIDYPGEEGSLFEIKCYGRVVNQ